MHFYEICVYGLMMNEFNQNENRYAIDFIVHHRLEFDYNMHEMTMSRCFVRYFSTYFSPYQHRAIAKVDSVHILLCSVLFCIPKFSI